MSKSEEVLVYFHGAFGFRRIEGYVEVYVPKIDAHVNLIGTWAGLHAMKSGFEYRLEGVDELTERPRPKLDEDLNVVFGFLREPLSRDFFCKIVVPWPQQDIQSLCPEPVDPATLFSRITSEAGGTIPKPSQLAHIQLYRFRTDGNPLRFVGRQNATSGKKAAAAAKPMIVEDEEGNQIYHLFCEPPHVFPTEGDRGRVTDHVMAKMADAEANGHVMSGHGPDPAELEAIRQYAPFTQHEHIALQEVLRMFPGMQSVEVSVPDAVVASDSPPGMAPAKGIRLKDLRSLYHLYPHFEGGHPACNPGGADGGT